MQPQLSATSSPESAAVKPAAVDLARGSAWTSTGPLLMVFGLYAAAVGSLGWMDLKGPRAGVLAEEMRLGLYLGAGAIAGVWCTLGTSRSLLRVPGTLATLALVCFAFPPSVLVAGPALVATSLPLAALRTCGLRLDWLGPHALPRPVLELQWPRFTILQMLGWTTAAAGLLWIGLQMGSARVDLGKICVFAAMVALPAWLICAVDFGESMEGGQWGLAAMGTIAGLAITCTVSRTRDMTPLAGLVAVEFLGLTAVGLAARHAGLRWAGGAAAVVSTEHPPDVVGQECR